jgi:hypothetical protein
MTATECPSLARLVADVEPAGPAPTTRTSMFTALIGTWCVEVGVYSIRGSVRMYSSFGQVPATAIYPRLGQDWSNERKALMVKGAVEDMGWPVERFLTV